MCKWTVEVQSRQPNGVFTVSIHAVWSVILQFMHLVCLCALRQIISPTLRLLGEPSSIILSIISMTIITEQEAAKRQRGEKKGSWNGAPCVWHNETKNEQDCWAEFTELRAGFTNSRRRLSHRVSAECRCFTQAPERLRSGRAEPTHTTLPMEQRRDPSPGANYPPPCHQRPTVSFKNHQCRRCRLNRSGAGIVERLLMIQINSDSVMRLTLNCKGN